jgi:uncharacterized protein (UPF0276 family)
MATAVGIAHADYADRLVREVPGLVDFIEIPFEQLLRVPSAIDIKAHVPVVLHCASLSIAGNVPLDDDGADQLAHWVRETETPWLGEHLAYVRADGLYRAGAAHHDVLLGSEAINVGYTVNPQFSAPVLDRVLSNLAHWEDRLGLPVLLENGPSYFSMPGSTMSQVEFIQALCRSRPNAGLLLDLTHLTITCANLGFDPFSILTQLPLDNVIEIHLSGMHDDQGIYWDDHARRAPAIVFDLLKNMLHQARPRAITIEYNWDGRFPVDVVVDDIARVRELLSAAAS